MVIDPKLRDQVAALCRDFQVAELLLFGSAARSELRPDSDLDLLVEFLPSSTVGLIGFAELQERLQALFGREVDLVTKAGLRPSIRDEVMAEAVPVYSHESLPAVR